MATPLSIKEKLHLYIETADEQKLEAIYTLLKDEINKGYSQEEIELFHQRRQNYLHNKNESYYAVASINAIRKARI
ncbi:MAG: hypothetical protein KA160_08765 [Lacibacter sp.]|nr:hypothetical protein [Lacibacter sp.]